MFLVDKVERNVTKYHEEYYFGRLRLDYCHAPEAYGTLQGDITFNVLPSN